MKQIRRDWALAVVVGVVLFGACSDDTATPAASSAGGAGGTSSDGGGGAGAGGTGAGGAAVCGTAASALDTTGLTVLAYGDGTPASNLREQTFQIGTGANTYVLNEESLFEAARFELEHPARIHGFEVMWAGLPDAAPPELELEAGLYGDFGYNGFDFWAKAPNWVGTRCAGDVDAKGGWLSYRFDAPIEVEHPGLVYVAHHANPGEPVWWFDASEPESCEPFDACPSAYNLPNAEANTYFNGLSFPFQRDFLVRLYVEYTTELTPAERLFQPAKASPENAHVSWGDYDVDGFDDLLAGNTLHKNQGDGTFVDVTAAAGLAGIGATGGVFGDYDNDGCPDLFLYTESYSQRDYLMHSECDGTFTDVTLAAGLDDTQSYNYCGDATKLTNTHTPSAAAAWFDLEGDGFLDLYVANFNCWVDYSYYADTVFTNDKDGTFTSKTGTQGFKTIKTPSRGVAPADADGDGDIDLFINNYVLAANLFYRNDGGAMVSEQGKALGLAGTKSGFYYGHTIGAAWGDLDNDADLDLVAANLAHPRFFHFSDKTQVLMQGPNGVFTDTTGPFEEPVSLAGLRYQETHSVPLLADFDQDGALDLVITAIYAGRPTDFYWGKGDGTFTLDAYHAGLTTENGWGVAAADYDHDGDMDIFASSLFVNAVSPQKKGHFLQVRARGTKANRDAIGATVKVKAGGITRIRHVQGGTGKGGQDSLYLHFGLGSAASVEEIRVVYPGGKESVWPGPIAADQRVWLTEDDPTVATGWAP
ncbi:MAG: CRTAC1 family protein [Myxococcales bacterium]|nr:CRTAC1 family protein [Myxococcales bacterium]